MRRALCLLALAACGRGNESPPRPAPTATVIADAKDAADAASVAIANDAPPSDPCVAEQRELGPGLVAERWPVASTPAAGEPCVDVVRADLAKYRLLARAGPGAQSATAWQMAFGFVAVTNAGMFHEGGEPVGLVVVDGKLHGLDNKKFSGYFAWDPVNANEPAVIMTGRNCAGFDLDTLKTHYRSIVQSYRLLDCNGKALPWADPKQYSAAAIGVDRLGNVVFLHARAGFTMRELSTALAAHDLAGAIFLEGGPEASLVVHGKAGTLERVGSYETGFVENDDNTAFWDLPNVIGLLPR